MAAINTVPKSIHLPLTSLSAPRVLMCSASVGTESSVTLQLRDGNARASVSANVDALELASSRPEATATATETAATTNPTKTKTSATVATPSSSSVTVLEASSASASVLENALTIGYPDPDMLADVLSTIQTASLKNKLGNSNNSNNNNNNNNDSCKKSSNKNTANRNSAPTILNTNSGAYLNNPNKITITRRSSSNKINVQTVSAATNTTISSISGSKTNYIKNCLIRSSSCSNTATNVTTLAQIMSNSSTSSAASLLSQHNNNSNCSNSSNFSNASSVGSSISVGSVSSSTSTNSNSNSNSNSNDSSSGHSGHSSSFKSNSRNVPGIVTAAASTNTTATGIGIVTVDTAPRKSRPKLSSPTRHGPQQCQICSKIFGNASALAKHKLTHSDERKYICSLCSKAFKRQDHLNGHMMTHRNKKPYECKADGCGKSYCDARSLRRHSENHHGGVTAQANNTLSATSAGAICSGQMSGQISSSSSSCSSTASSNGNAVTNSLSLSPATASGDASSPDGATCIRTYISTGSTVVDAATGIALSDEQIKAMNLPIKTGVTLLSPTTSVSSNVSSTASSSGCSSGGSNSNVSVNISGSGSVSASVSGKTSSNTTTVAASSPTIMLSDGTMLEGEGLTREQLDLISKIMQQTKQTSAQVTVSSPTSVSSYKINTETTPIQTRPRTWNMQLLNNAQNVTVTVEDGTDLITTAGSSSACSGSPEDVKEDDLNQQIVAAINPHLLNIVKIDKPVECNLCHRKFKNIPALNGHMRLHGGYFKKDPETKRSEKKDVSGPPLQTASIGVRALIEEKIISKRKDISKGSFVVPAPPSSSSNCGGGGGLGVVAGTGGVCGVAITGASSQSNSCLRRSVSDVESFLNAKSSTNSINNANSSTTTAVLPAATTIKSSNGLSIQQIDLPQSIEIFSGGQRQPKTLSLGSGANTITITTNNVPTTTTMSALTALKGGSNLSGGVANHADPKDSTLIELLKRGTRIAVTSKKTQFQSQTSTNMLLSNVAGTELTTIGSSVQTGRQIITNKNRTVIIPSDVHVVSTKSKVIPSSSSSCSGANNSTNVINSSSNACSTSSISFSDGTPLSLSIAPNQESITSLGDSSSITSRGGGVYTVTYTSDADASDLFDDGEVYNVSDTEMLLQTVDTMELLNEDEDDPQTNTNEHSDNFALLSETTDADHAGHAHQLVKLEPETGQSTQVKHTTPLPTFQQFHSKELIMQNSSQIQAIANMRGNSGTLGVLASPLHSPLAYPTPPSSHENVAQSSPFIEDAAAQFVDATHSFFGDKTDFSHVYFKTDESQSLHHAELSDNDNEKILKLKSVLEESSFDPSIKVEDLLNNTEDDAECDLHEFAETNLSFLDEDQEFLNDSRNATSPLSESFFTSGIGSAEDVKQVLREVLPDENMQLHLSSEQQGENIIDLYYLPGLGLQSQMMPNSDDPLLSSSPREFGQQRQIAFQGSSSTTVTVQAAEPLQATTMLYEQTPSDHQQQRQQQEQQRQDQQMEQILPQQAVIQSDQMQSQQQPQQQQQQSEFMLPAFNQVACHTTYLDATQPTIPMTLQPLNSLLQPLIYSNISGEKQEFNMPLNSRTGGHETVLDASLLFGCVDGDGNKPVNATDTVTSLPAVVPSSVSAVSAAGSISNLQPLSNQTNSILKRRLRSNGAQDMHKLSKFHTLSPHRSKLRKPSRTHYTPAPILNPDRKGTGLYCNVRKQLGQGIFDNFDDDFGDPVGLVDFSDESKVNLGSTYQAQIPAWKPPEEFMKEPSTSCGADLMWDPNVQLDDKILMRYIDLSKSSAVPMGSHSEEMALQTLLDAKGNSAAAVLTLLQMQSSAFQMKWTAFELEQFLRGLEKHGKDFAKITSELCTKTSGECVQMYYFWKKLCVDYKVSHLKMEPVVTSNHAVEQKPYVCEIAACSASFSSKAALHGHVRIHAYGRNASNSNSNNNNHNNHNNSNNQHATAINANNNNNNGNSNNNHSTSNSISIHSSNPCTTQTSSIIAITTTAITNTNNGMAVVSNNSNNNNSLLAGSSSLNSTLLLTAAPKTLPATKDCSNSNNSSNGNGTSNIAKDSEFPLQGVRQVRFTQDNFQQQDIANS
ncbi:pneumococcal serine-rich repeat protein isoform X1 [Drosophila nasuta]|uniref:pneumococcal serine-rich repeat protein isoform X1 n=1 Tax=Drosophila nasuta TaxID=42062 RepID=UPI00295E2AF2|nr:pneumococcal serine-rich repeat protein isoform X1 [Drosophila nasuta]